MSLTERRHVTFHSYMFAVVTVREVLRVSEVAKGLQIE